MMRVGYSTTLAYLVLLCGSYFAQSKITEGTLDLSSYVTEQYITKFSFSEGTKGLIRGNFSAIDGGENYFEGKPHDLRILLLDDEHWPAYSHASWTMQGQGSLCVERLRMANWQKRITPQSVGGHPMLVNRHMGAAEFEMEVPTKGRTRTHYWYAVVVDCFLEEYDAHPPPVHFDMFFYNGKSHLPADERGMPTTYGVVLVATVGFLGFVCNVMLSQYKKVGQVHLIVLLLGVAVALQTFSHMAELTHLLVYMRNGKGLKWRHSWIPMDFFAQMMLGMSELVIQFVLITLGFGWTLIGAAGADNHTPMLGALGRVLSTGGATKMRTVFFSLVAGAQVILMYMGRKYEDDFNQFHDFEHPPGYALMAVRVTLCLLFVLGVYGTIKGNLGEKVKSFELKLLVLGVVWFLAFPFLVVVLTPILEPYNRHPAVTGGSIVLQSVALGLMSTLFLQNSEYIKMSTLANMGTIFSPTTTVHKKWFKVAVD
ncbi:hypothetical protein CYMTET_11235 [Cymbomonas tetramitiformis]|uniref:GPR180/TMEM145 transmembrane domain-containing protein n=1 Tax=Cymbomonas tetramitiformis TaxID=36881 RepID=A0AAE0GMP9_9CHLO|nr:hypothetical protein CYMTET_11235 [Cymbomonas tetramitiformis]